MCVGHFFRASPSQMEEIHPGEIFLADFPLPSSSAAVWGSLNMGGKGMVKIPASWGCRPAQTEFPTALFSPCSFMWQRGFVLPLHDHT